MIQENKRKDLLDEIKSKLITQMPPKPSSDPPYHRWVIHTGMQKNMEKVTFSAWWALQSTTRFPEENNQ